MSKSRVDAEHRIELPGSKPGDVYDIQQQADGGYVLVRVKETTGRRPMSKEEVRRAIEESPLNLTMTWEELRKFTREL